LPGFIQSEYQRGVSAWNFDIEDLKAQASLVSLILLFTFSYKLPFHSTFDPLEITIKLPKLQIRDDEPSEIKEDEDIARNIEVEKVE